MGTSRLAALLLASVAAWAQTEDPRHAGRSSAQGPSAWKKRWIVEWSFSAGEAPGFAASKDGAVFTCGDKDEMEGFALRACDTEGRQRWVFALAEECLCAPACTKEGNVVVALLDGTLIEITPEGKERWRFSAGGPVTSSPVVGPEGTIYFGCRDDSVYAVTSEGKPRWSFRTGGFVNASPSLGADGTLYAASWDGSLRALDEQGHEKWRFQTGRPLSASAAIADDGTLYQASEDGNLYAIDPAGKELWRQATEGWICFAPCIDAKGNIAVASNDGLLYALTARGELRWRVQVGQPKSNLACDAGGNVYLCAENSLFAIDLQGKTLWRRDECAADCLALGADGTLYLQSSKRLYAVRD